MKKKSKFDQNYAKYVEYYKKFKTNNYMTPMLSKSEYRSKLKSLNEDLSLPKDEVEKKIFSNIKKNRARFIASNQTTLEKADVSVLKKTDEYKDVSVRELKKKNWREEYYKYNPTAKQEWTDPRTGITRQYTNRQAWYFLMMEIFDGDESMIY